MTGLFELESPAISLGRVLSPITADLLEAGVLLTCDFGTD